MQKDKSMRLETLMKEDSLCRDLESVSVSRRLVRSFSQKLKRRNHVAETGDECNTRAVSLSCLTFYGKGGGCKIGVDTGEDFGDGCDRRRSSASEEGKGYTNACGNEEIALDCYGMKEKFWRRNTRKVLQLKEAPQQESLNIFLPDDILEMCLVRLPLTSLMNACLVCKKWKRLASTTRFMQMRRDGLYQTPWLFIFGVVEDGYCSAEIHALDVSAGKWHKINADILRGRFLFSVASMMDDIFMVGGCSSLTNFGKVDRSSFKTHKGVLVFSPITKSWRKVTSMKCARSSPILGVSEVSSDWLINRTQNRSERRSYRSRIGGASDVYEDPHRLSVRRQFRHTLDEHATSSVHYHKPHIFTGNKDEQASKDQKRYVLIVVGGLGTWEEPLNSGELYDPVSNKWTDIQRLPLDFGIACSGVVCKSVFYVYSESDKLAGYDVERGYWVRIQTEFPPPRVHEYHPKLISCSSRLFMLSVSWCEGDGEIGRRNKAVRKLLELDLVYLNWKEVSTHPDAPMDWNAAFVADKSLIFGIEMFKIFGQMLDFLTVCDISDAGTGWSHISRNHVAHELDAASCMTKSMAVLHL